VWASVCCAQGASAQGLGGACYSSEGLTGSWAGLCRNRNLFQIVCLQWTVTILLYEKSPFCTLLFFIGAFLGIGRLESKIGGGWLHFIFTTSFPVTPTRSHNHHQLGFITPTDGRVKGVS